MAKPFANTGDPDQMPQNVASDLGLQYLPITLLGVSRLQWDKDLVPEKVLFQPKMYWYIFCLSLTLIFLHKNICCGTH